MCLTELLKRNWSNYCNFLRKRKTRFKETHGSTHTQFERILRGFSEYEKRGELSNPMQTICFNIYLGWSQASYVFLEWKHSRDESKDLLFCHFIFSMGWKVSCDSIWRWELCSSFFFFSVHIWYWIHTRNLLQTFRYRFGAHIARKWL